MDFFLNIIPTTKCNKNCHYCDSKVLVDTVNTINIVIDKNTLNKRYNKNCDCYITNAFINSKGILSPCFQYRNIISLNLLTANKTLNYYKVLNKLRFTCNKLFCYRYTNWVDY